MKKRELFLDIETYSEADIATCGAYKYIADPSFQILMISYAFDDGEVITVDLALSVKLFVALRLMRYLNGNIIYGY